jgi:hypothetical protein
LCVVVGLASNGVYDIPFIKNWIETWFVKKPVVELLVDAATEPLVVEEKKESTVCVKSVKKRTHKPATKKTAE